MAKGRKRKVDELLDSLLEGKKPEEVLGQEGLLGELTKRLVERALEGEMTAHLGYPKHAAGGRNGQNSRNGRVAKRVKTDSSEVAIEVPRDREGISSLSWYQSGAGGWRVSTTRCFRCTPGACPRARSRGT
jgi:transposase-like protein